MKPDTAAKWGELFRLTGALRNRNPAQPRRAAGRAARCLRRQLAPVQCAGEEGPLPRRLHRPERRRGPRRRSGRRRQAGADRDPVQPAAARGGRGRRLSPRPCRRRQGGGRQHLPVAGPATPAGAGRRPGDPARLTHPVHPHRAPADHRRSGRRRPGTAPGGQGRPLSGPEVPPRLCSGRAPAVGTGRHAQLRAEWRHGRRARPDRRPGHLHSGRVARRRRKPDRPPRHHDPRRHDARRPRHRRHHRWPDPPVGRA
uniref:LigA n=1 Tax=Parastrongyloides trichosuri TaxID=131310 RepID=A0A0N4ZVQ5_PARTI